MKYTISEWYGRLGNNIQQISNAIFYCKENKINFYCPPSYFAKEFNINFGNDSRISSRFFFHDGHTSDSSYKDFICNVELLNKSRRETLLNFLTPNFSFNINNPFDDDTLVIHIRSGDVFENNPPRYYVQNPLSFYKNIIEKYEKVIIVTEPDFLNPVLNELKKEKKVIVQSNDLINDFETLLRAKNLVTSGIGTFGIAAALCSKNIKNLYVSDLYLNEHLNYNMLINTDINVHITKLKNYIKIGEWKNLPEQKQVMMEYKI